MFTACCPRCKSEMEYETHFDGKRLQCGVCRHIFTASLQTTSKEVIPNTDHLSYCVNCKTFVEPQVVGTAEVTGGRTIIAPNGLGVTRVSSHTVYRKFCRNCGTRVFSQLDIDAAEAAKRAEKQQTVRTLLAGLVIIVLMFVALAVFLAVYNR